MKPSIQTYRFIQSAMLFVVLFMSRQVVFTQKQVTNLPSIFITTTNSQVVSSKEVWVPGMLTVISRDTTENLNMSVEIRGRGNSTWGFAKKPYRIKLKSKTNLLKMPAHAKDWVLLANHADKTLIRNSVAFKIGSILGFDFTPATRLVDLTLNNTYLGNYLLTDQVEVNPDRVDIDKQDTTDTTEPNITGGYLLEIDGFANTEPVWFSTPNGLRITVKSPDDEKINPKQFDYIKEYLTNFEKALFSTEYADPTKGYRSLVDSTSLINWYIASEITGNSDAFWSTFIYKKRLDDKMYFGPMWDYDIAFNNDNRLGDATEKLMSQHAHNYRKWIERMLHDEWFQAAVWRRWHAVSENGLLDTLNTYINQTKSLINISEQYNFKKWNVLNTRVYLETFLFDTYGAGVDYLKTYLKKRIDFLDENLGYIKPVVANATENNANVMPIRSAEVYTNSADGEISIRYNLLASQIMSLSIFDLAGHQKYRIECESEAGGNLLHVPLADFKPGMYFLRISNGEQAVITKKFIVRP